ncbi:MAG: sensor histidine kinase [Alphaproteobacteria bacterium]|nr:MAG: sensor histidine kinase [Alphaproteobacteria bacterium]
MNFQCLIAQVSGAVKGPEERLPKGRFSLYNGKKRKRQPMTLDLQPHRKTGETFPTKSSAQAAERLVAVVEELSQARDLDTVMAVVRKAARDLTGADGATFVLRDGDKCFYADENAISPLWKGQRFPMKNCISGWVMLNATPAVIEDIYKDPRIPAAAYRPTFVKSLAMVPIRQEAPIGAIGNYWAENRCPQPEEIAILQALANVTAVAIENVDLYRQLQEKLRALEASNEQLRRFAWIASHDLKSPLRSISSLSYWAEEDAKTPLPDATRAHLQTLRSRVLRMERLLDDLLAYALTEKDEGEPVPADIVIAAALETIAPPPGFAIFVDESLKRARVPAFALERVFAGLIGNAVKHHDRGAGTIRISMKEDDAGYVFGVADDGPGILPEHQAHIFEIFQTLKPRDKIEGSGMGLSIVSRILESHGETIRVESSGRGATFLFTWRKPLDAPGND